MKLSRREWSTIVFLLALIYMGASLAIRQGPTAGIDYFVALFVAIVAFAIGMKETIAGLKRTLHGNTDRHDA